ncbi:MAG: S1 RNA-binding domain-containing protein, partial [Patescibacteria group bacterium]
DPWKHVNERYQVGKIVKGKVLKVNPFGLFVELDPEIHGLAHVSELSNKPGVDPTSIATAGDEVEFRIVSIEPEEHRLGLSIKALKEEPTPAVIPSEGSTEAEPESKSSDDVPGDAPSAPEQTTEQTQD